MITQRDFDSARTKAQFDFDKLMEKFQRDWVGRRVNYIPEMPEGFEEDASEGRTFITGIRKSQQESYG